MSQARHGHPGERKRLCTAALVALLIHALALWIIGGRVQLEAASSISQPLIYSVAPVRIEVPARPAPARATPRRVRPPPSVSAHVPLLEPNPPPVAEVAPPQELPPPTSAPSSEVSVESVSQSETLAEPASPTPIPAPQEPALDWPGSMRLKYTIYGEVGGLPYHARGELLWAHDGQNYEARMEVGAFLLGSRTQISRGRLAPSGLEPQRFVDRVHKDRVAEFDRENKLIYFRENGTTQPLPADAQDQLSVFVQLGSRVAAAPQRYPAGTMVELPAIGVYGPETWRFVVGEDETLSLAGGEQRARKFIRVPGRADEPRADIWLAPALGWLPIRIRLSQDNGDYIDQQWRSTEAP